MRQKKDSFYLLQKMFSLNESQDAKSKTSIPGLIIKFKSFYFIPTAFINELNMFLEMICLKANEVN